MFIGTPLQRTAVSAHFQALAFELTHRGHEAVIIAPPGECEPDPGGPQFHVYSWPSVRPTKIADAALLWRLIGQYRPDCLVANFAPVNWMCLVGWLRNVKCRVAWYHTLSSQIVQDTPFTPGRLRLLRMRKRMVYRKATHLAVTSRAAMDDAGQVFGVPPEKCKVWRNSLPDPASTLNSWAGDRENIVICAGRFDRTKGQDVLIDAIALCSDRLGGVRFEFLGNGPLLDAMRSRAAQRGILDRCVFRGTVSHEEVLRRMAKALISIVPSRSEAFGLVNIESMAAATPVIASQVDGIVDIIRPNLDGFLVPPDDPRALAKRLMELLNDSGLRQKLGESARQRFLSSFEQSIVVKAQADWLEQITG